MALNVIKHTLSRFVMGMIHLYKILCVYVFPNHFREYVYSLISSDYTYSLYKVYSFRDNTHSKNLIRIY